jgi:hypothetical protein
MPSTPPALVVASRRALTKMHHPDRAGGDTERQRQVNVASDIIEGWLQRQGPEQPEQQQTAAAG